MSSKDITRNLALAIEVDPSEVLGYRNYYEKGYTVMLKDFRKFTGVVPVSDQETAAAFAPPPPIYPADMPDQLKPVYDNPAIFKVQKLKDLAYFLAIPDASALRKLALVEEIESWKSAYLEG